MKLTVNHHPTFNGEMFIRSFGWLTYSGFQLNRMIEPLVVC